MATNWGKTVAVIPLSDKTDLHINADAEMDGGKFLVLAKYVKTQNYSGPAKNGTILVPMSQLEAFKKAIDQAVMGA